jgi:hypothetical protein|tara:strand:- start:376 stop:543 length:168 start_codon:yes stop_codon:yes gene_type:complete
MAVLLGAVSVYTTTWYPIGSIVLAFLAGIIVTLSARFDMTVVRDEIPSNDEGVAT